MSRNYIRENLMPAKGAEITGVLNTVFSQNTMAPIASTPNDLDTAGA